MRDVLLYVERMPFSGQLRQILPEEIKSGYSEEDLRYATYLLLDSGYLDGVWSSGPTDPSVPPMVRAITTSGHELLEVTRNPDVWEAIRAALHEMDNASWSIDVLQSVAKRLAEEQLVKAVETDQAS